MVLLEVIKVYNCLDSKKDVFIWKMYVEFNVRNFFKIYIFKIKEIILLVFRVKWIMYKVC